MTWQFAHKHDRTKLQSHFRHHTLAVNGASCHSSAPRCSSEAAAVASRGAPCGVRAQASPATIQRQLRRIPRLNSPRRKPRPLQRSCGKTRQASRPQGASPSTTHRRAFVPPLQVAAYVRSLRGAPSAPLPSTRGAAPASGVTSEHAVRMQRHPQFAMAAAAAVAVAVQRAVLVGV